VDLQQRSCLDPHFSSRTIWSSPVQNIPETTIRHRSIQKIDILPTLSLLLGLPIPYNNLSTVIPEVFWRDRKGQLLENALQINASQTMRYLDTYRSSPSGGELDGG